MPGALSATGILFADVVRDYSRTVMLPGDAIATAADIFAELEQRGGAEFAAEDLKGVALRSLDVRYRRQGYELNVPYDAGRPSDAIDAFHRLHRQRYGFSDAGRPVEIVNLRLRMTAASDSYSPPQRQSVSGDGSAACYATRDVYFEGRFIPTRICRRDGLTPGDCIHGPAMITEYTSATVLPPDARAEVDSLGNLVITFAEEPAPKRWARHCAGLRSRPTSRNAATTPARSSTARAA
jgi:N-methylhydantoinase A